jgi:hypothetical protein
MLNESHSTPATPPLHDHRKMAAELGLDPFVAFGMVAIDWMLFTGLEVPSFGLLAVLSFFTGLALTIPCALIQRHVYGDSWGAAWGKALLCGLLTALPSSLPSFLTAGWGIVGVIGRNYRAAQRNTIDTDGSEVN